MKVATFLVAGTTLLTSLLAPVVGGAAAAAENNNILNAESVVTNDRGVEFKKTAEKIGNGRVKITLKASGEPTETSWRAPVYVSIVFDKSASMTQGGNSKYNEAASAAISFSKSVVDYGGYVNLVKYGTTATTATSFTNSALTTGGFNTSETSGQFTNLQDGIAEAAKSLQGVTAKGARKYIVVLGDGEPTACRTTSGTSNNNCTQTIALTTSSTTTSSSTGSGATNYQNAALAIASEAKNASNDMLIFTIGYSMGTSALLQSIASKDSVNNFAYYWEAPTAAELTEIFDTIGRTVGEYHAGEDATIYDKIGEDFEYVADTATGGAVISGKNVVCSFDYVTESGVSCSFVVELKHDIDVCAVDAPTEKWFKTNDSQYDELAGTSNVRLEYHPYDTTGTPSKDPETLLIAQDPKYLWLLSDEDLLAEGCYEGDITIKKTVTDMINPDADLYGDQVAEDVFTFLIYRNAKENQLYEALLDDCYVADVLCSWTDEGLLMLRAGETAVISMEDTRGVMAEEMAFSEDILARDYEYAANEDGVPTPEVIRDGEFFEFNNPYSYAVCEFDKDLLPNDPECVPPVPPCDGCGGVGLIVPNTGLVSLSQLTGVEGAAGNSFNVAPALAFSGLGGVAIARKKKAAKK